MQERMTAAERTGVLERIADVLGEETSLECWLRKMDAPGEAASDRMRRIPAWYDQERLDTLVEAVRPALAHEPDLTLLTGEDGKVYMLRWWLKRRLAADGSGGEHSLYVHGFWHDDPAGLHDHPWPSASLLLTGRVRDHTAGGRWTDVAAGDVVLRPASYRHRITLEGEPAGARPRAISLIATGGRRPGGWEIVHADGTVERIREGNTDGMARTLSRT